MSFLKYQKENPEFLNNYLKYKRFIQNLAESTVNEAYFDLRTFFRYIEVVVKNNVDIEKISIKNFRDTNIKNVTIEDLKKLNWNNITDFLKFLDYFLNNKPITRNKKLSSLKSFFKYLDINNLISSNPSKESDRGKLEKRLPKYLSLEESKHLLSKTINSNHKFKIRNYAITCLLLNSGLRVSELININIHDIKLDEKTIKIHGKGGNERLIYLNAAAYEAIKKYLKIRPNLLKDSIDYKALFVSSRNKRLSKRSVQFIIKEELSIVFGKEQKNFHTHSLRHTSATLLYNENDIDIHVLQKFLGHISIEATEKYTHISDQKMKYIMENCTISNFI